jgi:hypothetical protein
MRLWNDDEISTRSNRVTENRGSLEAEKRQSEGAVRTSFALAFAALAEEHEHRDPDADEHDHDVFVRLEFASVDDDIEQKDRDKLAGLRTVSRNDPGQPQRRVQSLVQSSPWRGPWSDS